MAVRTAAVLEGIVRLEASGTHSLIENLWKLSRYQKVLCNTEMNDPRTPTRKALWNKNI
jgi:hypothetical protein